MRCEPCFGTGRRPIPATLVRLPDGAVIVARWRVCDECRGSGVVSCCEGTERFAGVAGQPGSECGLGQSPEAAR